VSALVRALWILTGALLAVAIVTGYLAAWNVGGREPELRSTAVLSMVFAIVVGLGAAGLEGTTNDPR
jgi:preprotein translocase subunit SecG